MKKWYWIASFVIGTAVFFDIHSRLVANDLSFSNRRSVASDTPLPKYKHERAYGIDPGKYFDTFNYDKPEVAKQMPSYENELLDLCDQLISNGTVPKDRPANSKEEHAAAMALAYTAFYIGNLNYGAYYHKIAYTDLTQFRKFGPANSNLNDELVARENKSMQLADIAAVAVPEEEVIFGVSAASKLRQDIFKLGKPSNEAIERMIALTEAKPSFNIFASRNIFQLDDTKLTDAQENRIFEQYKARVEHRDLCHQHGKKPHVCKPNMKIVPFLLQEAGLFEGDAYFQHAARLIEKDPNSPEGWELIQTAQKLYEQAYTGYPDVPKIFRKASTKPSYTWEFRSSIDLRIAETKRALYEKTLPGQTFWSSRPARVTYECSTCHSHQDK